MRRIFLLAIVLSTTAFATAQPYSHYINHTSTWCMYTGAVDPGNYYVSHYRFMITGDTTIGSYDYFKLFRVGIDSVTPTWPGGIPSVTFDSSYYGALREDASGKFYFLYKDALTENLIYDFNLLVGNTLPNMYGNYSCNNPAAMVTGYDTVYLGTVPLRRYSFDNWTLSSLIEGVGSGGGPVEQGGMCMGFEHNSYLICYKKDNEILVVNPAFTCELTKEVIDTTHTNPVTTADSTDTQTHVFTIFPNPAQDQIKVYAGDGNEILEIRIINSIGQKVMFVPGLHQQNMVLDIRTLSKDVYFLTAKTNQGIITRSFVKS